MADKENTKKADVKILVGTRGRIFQGVVIKKFPTRVVIEFDRPIYIKKYERFYKKKTKIHSRLPESFSDVQIGDVVKVRETRPLSKIIHSIVIEVVRKFKEKENKEIN
mgnify:CR=1 FL=1